jgi:nucleoid-associated protein YgaU
MPKPVAMTSSGSVSAPAGSGPGAGAAFAKTPLNLQRAKLEMREPAADGTTGSIGGVLGVIEFQYNPKELVIAKNAKWNRDNKPNAEKSAPPQFMGSDPSKLNLEMFLDSTEKMDDGVVKTVEKLFSCCVPTEKSRTSKKGSPPWVIFSWGGLTGFPSYVSSVSAKYTLFTPAGMPVRALVTVVLEEIAGETGGQNPTSGALAARDSHTVIAGDTLPSVAYRAFGDPNAWREIAELNDIDDPLRLAPGSRLLIPAPEEVAARHGE